MPHASPSKNTEFDAQYARLNKVQKDAVDTIEGPVMVIAGPGTGKTTILTLRIANILRLTDTPAHGILAITYTDAGVKAMRAKLHAVIGNRAHEVAIHTFHSFASAMIAEYPDHFLHLDGLRNISSVEQESLIRTIIEDPQFSTIHPLGKPDAYVSAILHAVDTSKREAQTPEMIRHYVEKEIKRIESDESSISTRGATKGQLKADALEQIEKCKKTILFAEVYRLYEEKKKELKRMDFNDLIIELLDRLNDRDGDDKLFLRLIQERFLYIHIDEHQDTNDSQNLIIKLIADFFETPNVFIVGDEKQAIYRFQGASVENFFGLQKHWKDVKVIKLDTNYRSHQHILDASFSMIENNYEGDEYQDLRVKLTSGGKDITRPLDIVTGENVARIESYLVDQLKNSINDEPRATVAIITRRNRDLERIIRVLESAHIPVSSERSVDIFHHPVGATFFDLMEYVADSSRVDALGKTVAAGLWNLSFDDAVLVNKLLRSGQTTDLEKKIPVLLHIQRKMLNDGAISFIIELAEISGFTHLVSYDPAYVHVWRGIVALAESLAREGHIDSPRVLIEAMLAYRLSAETKTVKVSVGAPDLPIQALTAHGSKGLEFDYVFIPYATDESWIGRPRGASFVLPQKKVIDHDVKDTRRLFYVAITRAKKHAVILTGLTESDGKELTALRFLSELNEKTVNRIKVDPTQRVQGKSTINEARLTIHDKDADAVIPAKAGIQEQARSSKNKLEQPPSVATQPSGVLNSSVILDSRLRGNDTVSDFSTRDTKKGNYSASDIKNSVYIEYAEKILNLAKKTLLDNGLSVTALNNFLDCPSKFIYNSILRLPQASTPSSEKGTAMHEAMADIWHITDTQGRPAGKIEQIIKSSVEEYLRLSFLSRSEKESVKNELFEDAPVVARALEPHFLPKGTVHTERAVRTTLMCNFNNNEITIPIHGKLDAIVEEGGVVNVFDYKTKQAMSEAEIKGETKNSTGDYFRQLSFYKLLLQNDPWWKTKKIVPALVFISPDKKGRCPIITLPITDEDIEKVKKSVQTLVEAVWSGSIMIEHCGDEKCEWCGMKEMRMGK